MFSWSCSDPPYFALKYIKAGKVTGENRQQNQKWIDVHKAWKWQKVSGGERGEAELPAGARWNRKARSGRRWWEGARRDWEESKKKIQGVRFTGSQKRWGWQGHPRAGQAGLATAGCPRPCPAWFWISARMQTPQPLWAAWPSGQPPSWQKWVFLRSHWVSCAHAWDEVSFLGLSYYWPKSSLWAPRNVPHKWTRGRFIVRVGTKPEAAQEWWESTGMETPVSWRCGLEKCPKCEKKGWIAGPQTGKRKKLQQALRREQHMLRQGVSPN